MRMIICDRCRKEIDKDMGIGSICAQVSGVKGTVIKMNPYSKWDLCPSCMADIQEYIEAPIREREQEEKKEDRKPKAVVKKKRGADAEKIRELAASGLAPKDIAAEVGCSTQTVYNHMKEVTNETTEPVAEGLEED